MEISNQTLTSQWQSLKEKELLTSTTVKTSYLKLSMVRFLTENIITCLLQYCGLLLTTLTPQPYPVWLASGTACAFMVLRSYSILPGLMLGTYFAFMTTGFVYGASIQFALLWSIQSLIILWINQKWTAPTLLFYKTSELTKFIITTIIITMVFSLFFTKILSHTSIAFGTFIWLSNINGILALTLSLTILDAYFPEINKLSQLKWLPLLGFIFLFVIFLLGLLLSTNKTAIGFFIFNELIISLIISFYYGRCGNALVFTLFTLVTTLFIKITMVPMNQILILQILLFVQSIMMLYIPLLRYAGVKKHNSAIRINND